MNETAPSNLWRNAQFKVYLGSTAFSGTASSMQQLLVNWLLVGILLLPASQVGMIQALIGIPGIVLMLWGGATADQTDARTLLIKIYAIAWLFPMALVAMTQFGLLNIWSVSMFGVAMSTAISYSSPAQQAILNRVAGGDVQRAVTAASAVGFTVQIFGLALAGQMEIVGVSQVLVIQSISLILGAFAVTKIAPVIISRTGPRESTWQTIKAGLRATYEHKVVFQSLIITFVSGVFNAGAFMTALPFIVKRVYDGDAWGLATIMIVFYSGATISNVIQYKIMPLVKPGLWFLVMQFTRALILVVVWMEPSWWLLMPMMFVWGLNMGVTTNLSRAIVQEAAPQEYLARILSVYSLSIMGSMPIGALIVGFVIEGYGTMSALVPAMFVSIVLCIYGFLFTDVARYRSPQFAKD